MHSKTPLARLLLRSHLHGRKYKTLVSLALLPFYTVSVPKISPETREQERPLTIPALKEWTDGPAETYTFEATSRIVLEGAAASRLVETAEVFADDLLRLSGGDRPVVVTDTAQPGDIVLALGEADEALGDEGYRLNVAKCVTISAQHVRGVFYGTRTILQLLRQSYTIRGGSARDWPDYPERGLMIDNGRKYFSVAWLESHIRDLAYLKYNYFHLHVSDNYGFRLESERHPEIVSEQPDTIYTKAEIRSLIELARKYQITIIPEIDMPGHMDTILAKHPELWLTSVTGKQRPGDIDLSNPESYALMRDLLEEYIPLFPGPYWHIGADEYLLDSGGFTDNTYANYPQLETYARQHYGPNAIAKDTYLGFVNWANEIVKAHGKITRAWSDGLYGGSAVTLANDIIYEHWYGHGLTPQEIVDLGLSIVNGNATYLYYVLRPGVSWRAQPNSIYDAFEAHLFNGETTIDPQHQRHLGAKLHIWCDFPDAETEQQVAQGTEISLRALAQKNWSAGKPSADYNAFESLVQRIGRAPGYNIAPAATPAGEEHLISVSESLASTEEEEENS